MSEPSAAASVITCSRLARRTAASRDLPFGSIVRVTRRDNRAQVLVRVNDRGPCAGGGRILDLSRGAAELHTHAHGMLAVHNLSSLEDLAGSIAALLRR